MRVAKTINLNDAVGHELPADVPASELFRRLSESARPSEVVDFPRKGPDGEPLGQVRIVVLTERELIAASVEAERFAQKMLRTDTKANDGGSQGYLDVYRHESAVQIIHRACKRVEDAQARMPAFPSPQEIRDLMTPDEIGVLLEAYYLVQAKYGPIVARMSPEEVDAWIERLTEGGKAYPLAFLSSEMRDALIVRICSQLQTSPTDSYSAGSRPVESDNSKSSDSMQESSRT